jgi:prepilin-type N-terminal cleavage/methylation domain-containing protein
MNMPHRTHRGGFTLLEVLVALFILLFGIVAVMQFFPVSLLQARTAAERTVSSQAADSVLGQIRQFGAASLFNDQLPRTLLHFDRADGIYGYDTTIQRLNAPANVSFQRVTLTVTLPNGRQQTFVTYVSEQ